ncbi:hypothetical protein BGZ98_007658 [Dissophora globulifera]|nr:hypothetical protein BGZ98_007658 [Dissophora globulifera]
MLAKTTICALAAAVIVALMTSTSEAHSWIDCTDWRITNKKTPWAANSGHCVAWGRQFPMKTDKKSGKQTVTAPFGKLDSADPNRHYQQNPKDFTSCSDRKHGREPGADESRKNPITSSYGNKFGVMATATPGQEICLRWPAKNHAVSSETKMAHRSFVFWDPKPVTAGTKDPTEKQFYGKNSDAYTKANNGGQPQTSGNPYFIKELAYNDCSVIKGNTDLTPCGGCFNVPKTAKAGSIYMFHWRWQLNPNEFYTSCWDIKITKPATSSSKLVAGSNSTVFSDLESF